jgi:hypothetical protein
MLHSSAQETPMALTQMQLIQSLGEAMSWFERELNWGVPATELRHLVGRIGELYAALITNGQMANEVNQRGYDVVTGDGERVSVKTTAQAGNSGHVAFNANTFRDVDRIIVLRVNTEEMQIETLLNAPTSEVIEKMGLANSSGKVALLLSKLGNIKRDSSDLKIVNVASFDGYEVRELESGTIEVYFEGQRISPAKPALRELALRLNVSVLNSNGNPYNTRQLGTYVIEAASRIGSSIRQKR